MVHHLTCEKLQVEHGFSTRSMVKKVPSASKNHKAVTATTLPSITPKSQTLVHKIIHIYQQLARASHLAPCEPINALFTELVYISTLPADKTTLHQVLTHPKIRQLRPHLRQLCSRGEYLMESAWTQNYLNSNPTTITTTDTCDWKMTMKQQLSRFLYYDNYVDLTRLECHALLAVGARLENIVWIGSGPLPMSSIEMMLQHNATIQRLEHIDMDPDAIAISSQLNDTLPWPSSVRSRFGYHAMNALDYPHYNFADVICLAALVGGADTSDDDGGKDKLDMIIQVAQKMRPGSWLLIRSAHGLRQLLYPALKPSVHWHTCQGLQGLLEIVLELHPHNDVVNSVLIARRIG